MTTTLQRSWMAVAITLAALWSAAPASAQSVVAGPDAFGYTAYAYPAYLRDVSATGTFVSLGDDQVSGSIGLPFTFNFYGVAMNSVQISSNGFLRFPPADFNSLCCSGGVLPGFYGNIAAGYWTDLNLPQGNIRHQVVGVTPNRQFVVGFYDVPHYFNGLRVTFEIILHETTNAVEFQYGHSPTDHGHTHTIGIQNNAGAGLQIERGQIDYFNQGFLITAGVGPSLSAGPDAFGNRAIKVSPHLRNVSASGTFVPLGDDQASGSIALPFTFNFYGVPMTTVQISSNGFLRFPPADFNSLCCHGGALPNAFFGNIAAGYWTDLNLPQGNIRYGTVGTAPHRRFVVGFYDVPHYSNGPRVTFEMILHEETNAIEFQYGNSPSDHGHTQTVGIQNGSDGLQIARGQLDLFNTGFLIDAADFVPNVPPTAEAGANQTAEATSPAGADFALDGSGSSDPEGPFTYEWAGPFGSASGVSPTVTLGPPPAGQQSVTHTVTLTVEDVDESTDSDTVGLTVTDTTGPVIAGSPGDFTTEGNELGGASVDFGPLTASDLVDGDQPVSCSHSPGSFALGATLVSCSASDLHTNSSDTSFTITVVDTTGPAISGNPGDISVEGNQPGGADVAFAALTASDIVDGDRPVACSHAAGFFALGTTEVTCTSSDLSSNGSSTSFNVTVVDTTGPAIAGNPGDISVEGDRLGGANVSFAALTASDIVDGDRPVACSHAPGFFSLGTTEVTCTSADLSSNGSSTSFNVTVVDTTAPALTLPAPISVHATGPAGAAVAFTATATDIVWGNIAVVCAPPSGVFPLGETTVNCRAIDSSDNTGTGSFTVTVTNQAPMCTATPSVSLLWGPNQAMVPIGLNGVTDPEGDSFTVTVTDVRQDEPTNGRGDGYTAVDAAGVGTSTAQVRVERSGTGDGRVYHIYYSATDNVGASCTGVVNVGVPHDQRNGGVPVDGGALFSSFTDLP